MFKTSLIIIGGFLGAGKTTSILEMSRHFIEAGMKIGIVTNDQGSRLVDTNFLKSQGFPVLEVDGGCFCCNFDQFTEKVNKLAEENMPDVILAEPVGSCTDLIATIFKPLQLDSCRQFSLKPLSIVADPARVRRLMMDKGSSPFPNEINYLFTKQLEEADLIVLNKTDLLTNNEVNEITSFLKNRFTGIDVMHVSAKNNKGINEWASRLFQMPEPEHKALSIDYPSYAKAEGYLGWLNSSAMLHSGNSNNMNSFISDLMSCFKDALALGRLEIAHLKVYAVARDDWAKASITSLEGQVSFDRSMQNNAKEASLIINARINADPAVLRPLLEQCIIKVCETYNISIKDMLIDCFKPGYPVPKHRMA